MSGLDYPPSQSILLPLKHENINLFGPGPTNCSPQICHASSLQMYGIMTPQLHSVLQDVQEGLKYVFQTQNTLTYAINASGTGGMETAFVNLVEPGDKVLSLSNGYWGVLANDIAERCGAVTNLLEHAPGVPFSLEEVEEALKEYNPQILYVAQSESSSGLLQPIEGLGSLCHQFDCLLVVDTVASLGAAPFYMDRWEVDVVYTATQKALGCPPGLAPISFSERAKNKILSRKTKVQSFYFDVTRCMSYWGIDGMQRVYHQTPSSTLLCALREGLSTIAQEGLEASWERHHKNCELIWKGVQDLGLELYIRNPDLRLPTITAIIIPEDIDNPYRVNAYAMKAGIELGGALPPLAGKVWRIGLMGYNSTEHCAQTALTAFKDGLVSIGYQPKLKAEL